MQYQLPEEFDGLTEEQVREEMDEYGLRGPGDSHTDVLIVKTAVGYEADQTRFYDPPFESVVRMLREAHGMDDSPFIDPLIMSIIEKAMARSKSVF